MRSRLTITTVVLAAIVLGGALGWLLRAVLHEPADTVDRYCLVSSETAASRAAEAGMLVTTSGSGCIDRELLICINWKHQELAVGNCDLTSTASE